MRIRRDPARPDRSTEGGKTLRIFLNYRRDDSSGHAGRLYDSLVESYGENVFMDVDAIEPGLDFSKVVEKTVAITDVLLAMIGREWLDAADATGNSRLQDPGDFVRIEIRTALERDGTRVIPVLVEGASIPHEQALPEDLAPLARRNAVELRDTSWSADVSHLMDALERIADEKAAAETTDAQAGIEDPGERAGRTPTDSSAGPGSRFRTRLSSRSGRMTAAGLLCLLVLGAAVLLISRKGGTPSACDITQTASLGGHTSTKIEFVNKTRGTVKIDWLDYKGNRKFWDALGPDQSTTETTWAGNAWMAIDGAGDCVGYVVAPRARYVIGGAG